MTVSLRSNAKRPLDPIDRFSEILFGLIMVLTFTCSISAAESGREDVRTMLVGAIGCNLAWGLVDGVMYLFACITERGRGLHAIHAVRLARNSTDAHRVIRDALPPIVASLMNSTELDALHTRINQIPDPPAMPWLTRHDFYAAFCVLLLVFASTFPVVIPFLLFENPIRALRVSNAVAIVMLFVIGYRLGTLMGIRSWWLGLSMVLIGIVLVGITIALGG